MVSPKISVVMPIYNTPEEHLRESVESILKQTFTDFELLIVNDSPNNDNLSAIIASYDDPRIVYLKNEKNQGLEYSTNLLIEKSKGKYIAIFDHDDISLPERLEKESGYLDTHPKVGAVSAQFTVFGAENWTSQNPIDDSDIRKQLLETSCVSHTTMMVRKSVIIKNNLKYEKTFFPAASYRMITQIALASRVHNLPEVLLKYRMDGNNTSLKFSELRLKAREKIRFEFRNGLEEKKIKDKFKLDSIEGFKDDLDREEKRYYKAIKGADKLFVKSSTFDYDHEYYISKQLFDKNPAFFAEPVEYSKDGTVKYFITKWIDGVGLDKFIESGSITESQKKIFSRDLYEIYKILRNEYIVHRDLIPRNFMVVESHLVLLDFYWAVRFNDYQEYDYVRDDLLLISSLGEDFAKGRYEWDDAYSISKLMEYIGVPSNDANLKNISKKIGDRVVKPNSEMFYETIFSSRQKLDGLHKQNNELWKSISDKEGKIVELQNQLSEKDGKIVYLENQISEFESSYSWKITKPLRAVARNVKRK